jgi:hypothetical protein
MPSEWKAGIGVLVVAGLLGGGWFAADRLTAAHAQVASTVLETTVRKLVTVRENGKVVQRVVPVIKQTRLKYSTRVVTTPGQLRTRTVRSVVTTRVPVVKSRVITVNGKTRTVATTRLVPTTRTETAVQTRTKTVTDTQNVTQPASTVTKTQTQTVTQSTTVTKTDTVTLPAETINSTITETVTVTTRPGKP